VCLSKLKSCGYNVWWSSETLWFIIKIEQYSVSQQPESLSSLSAECMMERACGSSIDKNARPKNQKSLVSLLLDEELNVKDFSFEWLSRPKIP
jgi:hypothetical protein